MPKSSLLVSIPTIAVAALALSWLIPPRGLEAAAESRADFSVTKQLFDPELFGDGRSRFFGGADQAAVEGRSAGRNAEPAAIPTQIRQAPAAPQCEPSPAARRFEPQYG